MSRESEASQSLCHRLAGTPFAFAAHSQLLAFANGHRWPPIQRRKWRRRIFGDFISTLSERGFVGCNVTIPHKEAAFRLVRVDDEPTRRVGAVNTIFFSDRQTVGINTDGYGFVANLAQRLPGLESGRQVRAAAWLRRRGASHRGRASSPRRGRIMLANRTQDAPSDCASIFGRASWSRFLAGSREPAGGSGSSHQQHFARHERRARSWQFRLPGCRGHRRCAISSMFLWRRHCFARRGSTAIPSSTGWACCFIRPSPVSRNGSASGPRSPSSCAGCSRTTSSAR